MEDKNFAERMGSMVKEHGKDILLNGKAKAYISDYRGPFNKEATIFLKLLDADCGKFINEADNVLERKRQLVQRMEDEQFISPNFSMEMLDLLGFLLKGDTTKCAEQSAQEAAQKAAEKAAKEAADNAARARSAANKAAKDAAEQAARDAAAKAAQDKAAADKATRDAAAAKTTSSTSSSNISVNKTAVFFGAIIGAAALGILPGFGFFRLIIGAAAGILLGKFVNRKDKSHGFFYYYSDELFVAAFIVTILFTLIGGLVLWTGWGYKMFLWSAFCLAMLIIFKVKDGDFTIRGEGLANSACLAIAIAGILFFLKPAVIPGVSSLFGKIKPAAVENEAVQAQVQTVTVNNDTLNFRDKPSTDGKILHTLKRGDVLTVIGEAENGWLPVQFGSFNGYVGAQYVSSTQQSQTNQSSSSANTATNTTTSTTTNNTPTALTREQALDALVGEYTGTYEAGQGKTGLTLTVYKEGNNYKALFDFYNLPDNNNVDTGSYYMNVTYNQSNKIYSLNGYEWIKNPGSYGFADLEGKLTDNVFSGSTFNFKVTKVK